jgi:hypothetical protein
MKKTDTEIQIPTKQRKTMPKKPRSPQAWAERRNPANNHWEFNGMLLDMVNQNIQEALKKFQEDKKKKNLRKPKNKKMKS